MSNYNFIAGNKFDLEDLSSFEKFVDAYPDFQTIHLDNENELILLLKLIGIENCNAKEIDSAEFSKYWDVSKFKFPEYNEIEFDLFYKNWIKRTSRNNTMDEYGSLIFLQGLSKKWNSFNNRLIIKESL